MTDENQPWWLYMSAVYPGNFSIEWIRSSLEKMFKDVYKDFKIPSLISCNE